MEQNKVEELMTHKELVEIAYRWCLKNAECNIAFKELDCSINGEIPDVIGFNSWGHSVVIECKVSYSDFKGDKRKGFRINHSKGMGRFRFYCCPVGLIKKEELPDGWGLIYVDGNKAKTVYNPFGALCRFNKEYPEYNQIAEHTFLVSALRRIFIQGLAPKIYSKTYERIDVNTLIERNEFDATIKTKSNATTEQG